MKHALLKKLLVVILVVTVVAPLASLAPIAVPKAEAQLAVAVAADLPRVTDDILKKVAILAAKIAIQSLTKSMITWINGGFNGSPAFETNLNADLQRLGDATESVFINNLLTTAQVQSPFLNQVVGDVGLAYYAQTNPRGFASQLQYTLAQATGGHDQAFINGDFSQGGFNGWFAEILNCANNAYCAKYSVEEQLQNRLAAAGQQRLAELNWGQGFLSFRGACSPAATAATTGRTSGSLSGDQNSIEAVLADTSLSGAEGCSQNSIQTPGSLTEQALGITATSPLRTLEVADSIDKVLGALASELITKVFTNGGLAGVSKPASGGGPSPLTNATNPANGNDSTLATAFLGTLSTEYTQVQSYQQNVQTILTAAQAAQATLQSSASTCPIGNALLQSTVTPVLQSAEQALTQSTQALKILDTMQKQVASAEVAGGAAEATASTQIQTDYKCLLSGGTPATDSTTGVQSCTPGTNLLPTQDQINYVAAQSQNGVSTLYSHMQEIAKGACL